MIPLRVKLSGFLCYKEEQEISFEGSPLWMLAGLNGSGKSSIFDAVTYALFGHHRGGHQQASELINKDSNGLAVEFEFRLDQERFQIRRTLKRTAKGTTSSTQQLFRYESEAKGGKGGFVAVPDTTKKIDFDNWVRDHVGMSYETFTSSVLLLQGRAEKLLDSTNKDRHSVLAGIVDLERYQRLHELADTRRRELKGELDGLINLLESIPEVLPEQLAEADAAIAQAQAAVAQAEAEVSRFQILETQATHWLGVKNRLAELTARLRTAQSLIGEASAIERDMARLTELRTQLPHLETIVVQQAALVECERKLNDIAARRASAEARLVTTRTDLGIAKQRKLAIEKELDSEEKQLRIVTNRLRELAGLLAHVKSFETQQTEVTRLTAELTALPADTEVKLREARQAESRINELNRVLPALIRLHNRRSELLVARQRTEKQAELQRRLQTKGENLKKRQLELEQQIPGLTENLKRLDEQLTEARTLAHQATQALTQLSQIDGATTCNLCGQTLTEQHMADERRRREAEAHIRQEQLAICTANRDQAAIVQKNLSDERDSLTAQLDKLREEFVDARTQAKHGREEVTRLENDCAEAFAELSEEYQEKIALAEPIDWATTVYPSEAELTSLKAEVANLPRLKRQLTEAEALHKKRQSAQTRADDARAVLDRMRTELPAEPQKLEQESEELTAEEKRRIRAIDAAKANLKAVSAELDRLFREESDLQTDLADLTGLANTENLARKHAQDQLHSARRALPATAAVTADNLGMGGVQRLKIERDELVKRDTEVRHEQLRLARESIQGMQAHLREMEREAAGFDEEARRDPAEFRQLRQLARQRQTERENEVRVADSARRQLDDYLSRRATIASQINAVEREWHLFVTIAQLLGRDRLQRHLMRVAERQIVDHANAVLDRLSSGQLYLRLCGGEDGTGTERILDLEVVNRSTGGNAINVAFLSGSQRFRVAVSLALGIGQYASRQHRPIESVIIDEGFGCLDRQGRQVMIQELQNLRGHLHCILLVSHQEEFAEAFSDGYQFRLENGAARVSRFQR